MPVRRLPRASRAGSFPSSLTVDAEKCHDLLHGHDQMGKHDCYWRAKVRKTNWVPDRDPGLSLREFLPSIKNMAEERYIQLRAADLASLSTLFAMEEHALRGPKGATKSDVGVRNE